MTRMQITRFGGPGVFRAFEHAAPPIALLEPEGLAPGDAPR